MYKNHEGYSDPGAGKAIIRAGQHGLRKMDIVYAYTAKRAERLAYVRL